MSIDKYLKLNGRVFLFLLCVSFSLLLIRCTGEPKAVLHYVKPAYKPIYLAQTNDTLRFPLHAKTYNSVRSLNYFIEGGKEYVSVYDKQSISINLYDFNSQTLIKRISLQSCLPNQNLEKHTTVYYKGLDSLFVSANRTLFFLDSSFHIKDSINYLSDPFYTFSSFGSACPPIFKNGKIYTAASPYLSTKKKNEYRKWKVIYQLDLKNNVAKLAYNLPQVYHDSLLGSYFFEASYCLNSKGRIVLSFPADTNIYETDLEDYHVAYYGKSIYQKENINAVEKEDLEDRNGAKAAFLVRDTYGDIYYDSYHKIYLRIAKQKMTDRELMLGKKEKDRSLILFDEDFRIISEFKLNESLTLSNFFITNDGRLYMRTKVKDEYALYFVRLEYKEGDVENKLASFNH